MGRGRGRGWRRAGEEGEGSLVLLEWNLKSTVVAVNLKWLYFFVPFHLFICFLFFLTPLLLSPCEDTHTHKQISDASRRLQTLQVTLPSRIHVRIQSPVRCPLFTAICQTERSGSRDRRPRPPCREGESRLRLHHKNAFLFFVIFYFGEGG